MTRPYPTSAEALLQLSELLSTQAPALRQWAAGEHLLLDWGATMEAQRTALMEYKENPSPARKVEGGAGVWEAAETEQATTPETYHEVVMHHHNGKAHGGGKLQWSITF